MEPIKKRLGSSGSGKTSTIAKLMERRHLHFPDVTKFIYFHHERAPPKIDNILCLPGMVDMDIVRSFSSEKLVVFCDDQQSQLESKEGSKLIADIYNVESSHVPFTFILLVQSIFKLCRDVRISAKYILIFDSKGDGLNSRNVIQQTFGSQQYKRALECFLDATRNKPYSSLLIDNCPQTPDEFRLLTDITSDYPIVYVPR